MDPDKRDSWAASAVSLYSLTLLLAALAFAYLTKNENMMLIIVGAVVANSTTVVNFYMGSSSSSQKKDATIAGQLPTTMTTPTTPTPTTNNQP
jgi:lipopolysaccharide export LptBFGC system permease protein LptF